MNDPKRLREETDSELARVLLRAGSRSPWPSSRRNRVLAALGVGLALTSTKETAFAALATWQKVAVVGCIACASAGGAVAISQTTSADAQSTDESQIQSASVSQTPAQRADEERPESVVAPTPADESEAAPTKAEKEESRTAPSPPRSADAPARRARPAPASSPAPDQMREELAMLERARGAVREGSGARALAALRAYSQRFPKGNLRFEAEVLRIEALASEGRTAEASKRAQRILKRNPRSVVAPRLERYVIE